VKMRSLKNWFSSSWLPIRNFKNEIFRWINSPHVSFKTTNGISVFPGLRIFSVLLE
jgi:hypothetical protein